MWTIERSSQPLPYSPVNWFSQVLLSFSPDRHKGNGLEWSLGYVINVNGHCMSTTVTLVLLLLTCY